MIFDLEGIVAATESVWDEAQTELLARRGLQYHRDKIKHLLTGLSDSASVQLLRDHYGLTEGIPELRAERRELVRAAIRRNVGFVPGFHQFFRAITQSDIPGHQVCLATAMDDGLLDIVVAKLDLRDLFGDRIFPISCTEAKSKQEPTLFLHVADQLGLRPSRCVVIEDAPGAITGARRAGMRCVALATTHAVHALSEADYVFETWAAVPSP